MDLQTFFDNFELFAESSNGVQKLRELILQLAIQGKLVPQDPNDEPALMLLGPYRDAISVLTEENGLSEAEVHPEEVPWPLPVGWVWGRLGQLVKFIGGSQPPKSKFIYEWREGYTRLVQIRDFKSDTFQTFVPNEFANRPFRADDVMIGRYGPPVFQILRGLTGTYNVALMKASPIETVLPKDFLFFLLQEPRIQRAVIAESERTAGQSGVRKELLHSFIVGVPPLKEQKRIVAKVDELMKFCNTLEKGQQKRHEARVHLNNSALEHLLAVNTPEEFSAHWQRVCDNFDLLYDTPETMGKLRQLVLQLAVQGKLVPQDQNDEPASVLLRRVLLEKERQYVENKSRQVEPLPPVRESEKPSRVLQGWDWERLGNLARFVDYRGNTPPKTSQGVKLVTAKNIRKGFINDEPKEYISEETYQKWMTRGFPKYGDILFTTEAPLGNVAQLLTHERIALAQRVINLQLFSDLYAPFFTICLMSSPIQQSIVEKATGITAQGIKASKLRLVWIPVPPLEEQKRIVAKVDQLMKLCDTLETKLNQAQSLGQSLTASVVNHISQSPRGCDGNQTS